MLGAFDIFSEGLIVAWNNYSQGLDLPHGEHSGNMIDVMRHFIVHEEIIKHLGEIAEILFFLLGAMTIVENTDKHDGFKIITDKITTTSKVKLLWILSIHTFFMSAALNNLTTTIVMIALLRKLITDKETRWFFASMIVLAAGVAAMGLEKIDFIWYLKRISLLALVGYIAGTTVYYLQAILLGPYTP